MLIGALHPTYKPTLKQLNKPRSISVTPFWKKKKELPPKWFLPRPEQLVTDEQLQGELDE